ncbi:MAG TPA: PIG-L family deacetylase [Prolixibacteraceae bacterium]|jgi:LmbE family N-acetylglucosaminyl deacetylase
MNRYILQSGTAEGEKSKNVAIIVAHPDDETLWAGGTILSHPSWNWFIVCLSRKNDMERANKFYRVLQIFNAKGIMGDLDDGPDQMPQEEKVVEDAILDLLPPMFFDLIISHNPTGEYTRHIRHEEISRAVIQLWYVGKIFANELWTFAYEDGGKKYYPLPVENANIWRLLTQRIWLRKYSIMTETYGFEKGSWEAETTPLAEAFWQFTDPNDANRWLENNG